MSRHGVCVIEDDPDIREAMRFALELAGVEVVEAADGKAALEQLRRQPCCLIVLDLMMPGMNGWDFRASQRADPALAKIPVVVLSGARDVAAQSIELEADGYLQKPIELAKLTDLVERTCARS